MKVVLDSNVLLAAFTTRGMCEAVLAVCLDAHRLFISQPILDEVQRNLVRKFKMSPAQAGDYILLLIEEAEIVTALDVPLSACRDKDDLPVLGTLLAASAECLVTGDQDLLALKKFKTIPILTPRAFYERFK